MIRLELKPLKTVEDARSMLETAIGLEFGTLPPYLYAMFSIPPGKNVAAANLIKSVLMQEMIHMCLACNIMNALGGTVKLVPPKYPGPLPGDIGPIGKDALVIHLYRLSKEGMKQGMDIEQPETIPNFPVLKAAPGVPATGTIGQFYQRLDDFLATLPPGVWKKGRNQITDNQFFTGQLFAVNDYADAHRAIEEIVSEGEGAKDEPLDFQQELAHYYRFGEVYHDRVLTKIAKPPGYQWGPAKLGVIWKDVFPAIPDPGTHDFSKDSAAARAAQAACNAAYTRMVDALQQAVTGTKGALGNAVRAMFDLRLATQVALRTPLADGVSVAGPAFLYTPIKGGAKA
ncbi:MAG TPA: ferritin-like protein [Allosphingosinicella sp.]|nr:ferritin-like protein [Allosphingosinicella sp.]